jgi:trans-aconitate methyltransferase
MEGGRGACDSIVAHAALREAAMNPLLVRQFGNPEGVLGSLAGFVMAHRPSNRERNAWVVSLLDLRPGDRVLEVGFGPGYALSLVARELPGGSIVGIDRSAVMVAQASRRNRDAIAAGRMHLVRGDVGALASRGLRFDKIFAVNSIAFWDDREACLSRLRDALVPRGTIALAVQPRSRGATDLTAHEAGTRIAEMLERCGFAGVRVEIRSMKPVATSCALAQQPANQEGDAAPQAPCSEATPHGDSAGR